MVARPKSPDGRSVTHAAKFSEAESAAVDAVRGDVRWSEWLRDVALAAAGHVSPPPAAASEPVYRNEPVNLNPVAVNRNLEGIEVNRNVAVNRNEAPGAPARKPASPLAAAGLVPASSLPKPRRCSHPGKRSVGGWCKECDHLIEPGGAWA
jgi:hypothetical protein